MNSQSYKRKRVDVQYANPEVASSIYERLGVDILTTPTTSGRDVEVEPPRKRYIQADQAVFHSGPTRTAGRVVQNGVAKPLLSNEQIQQFITSTVLPSGRSVTSTETVNPNVTKCTVYPSQPETRIQQQTDFTNVQPQLILNELRSGQTLPWVSIQQPSQETKQQLVLNSQGYIHPSDQSTFAVQILNPILTQAELQQPISANKLVLPTNFETQGSTPTIVTDVWVNGTRLQFPTNITNVPSVTGVYDQTIQLPPQVISGVSGNCYYNGVYSPVVTPTPNVTTPGSSADYPQKSSVVQLESWGLRPQSVPTFEAPMEAQTKTKTKRSKKKTTANISQGQYATFGKISPSNSSVAKGSRNEMDVKVMRQAGKPMDASLHQTQHSVPTSATQKGGKGAKRIVVPPKVQTDPVEYPPYVARIMRILNRQKQGQVESTGDNKESVDSSSKQMTTSRKDIKDRADSSSQQDTSAVKKAVNTVDLPIDQKEPQCVVSRTAVPQKQPALEQEIQHKSLSSKDVQNVNERCSQLNSGSKRETMSIKKTLPEDYKPVVNTALLLDDWSPDSFTLLEADSFYGPEILVTSGSHCFVASVPFF